MRRNNPLAFLAAIFSATAIAWLLGYEHPPERLVSAPDFSSAFLALDIRGYPVRTLWCEQALNIDSELYLGITLDRAASRNTFMASAEGGMEIEEVAARAPEKILRASIDPVVGLAGYQARDLAFGLGLSGASIAKFAGFAQAVYRAFVETDASIVALRAYAPVGPSGRKPSAPTPAFCWS